MGLSHSDSKIRQAVSAAQVGRMIPVVTGYLENDLTLPQGDSDVDYSNFLLGLSLTDSGWCLRLGRSRKEKLHIGVWM